MTEVLSTDPLAQAWLLPTKMLHAINSNDRLCAAQALEAGLDCDHRFKYGSKYQPALSLCVDRGRLEIMKLLISAGCSVNQLDSSGCSPLHSAAQLGHTAIVRLLLRHRANPNACNALSQTPLHGAAERGLLDVVQLLVQAGVDLDRADFSGRTALMNACAFGRHEVALLLLEWGADARPVSGSAESALHLVSARPEPAGERLVGALLAAGARLEARSATGCTPLHLALLAGQRRTAAALLRAGADPAARTPGRQSALQLAAAQGRADLLRLLLLHGAPPDDADLLRNTPLSVAARAGAGAALELLLAAGARPEPRPAADGRLWPEVGDEAARRRLWAVARAPPPLAAVCRSSVLALRLRRPEETISQLPLPAALRRYLAMAEPPLEEPPAD